MEGKSYLLCVELCFQAAHKSAAALAGSANIRTWRWLKFVI
jgi:hypothetical protein